MIQHAVISNILSPKGMIIAPLIPRPSPNKGHSPKVILCQLHSHTCWFLSAISKRREQDEVCLAMLLLDPNPNVLSRIPQLKFSKCVLPAGWGSSIWLPVTYIGQPKCLAVPWCSLRQKGVCKWTKSFKEWNIPQKKSLLLLKMPFYCLTHECFGFFSSGRFQNETTLKISAGCINVFGNINNN